MPEPLILVPTAMERARLLPHLAASPSVARVELCGFGVAAAAARTAALLARLAPARVILVGIAGGYAGGPEPGTALRFARVACHGIGAGTGAAFVPAAALGWMQWPGEPPDGAGAVGDTITLDDAATDGPLLLTVTAAAASAADVQDRLRLFPSAVAEEMEGFAVALACRLARVPCGIVRGISNVAGDRDISRWRTDAALAAAARLVTDVLGRPAP